MPAAPDEARFGGLAPYRPASYDEEDVSDKPEWLRAFPRLSEEDHRRLEDVHRRQVETLQAVDRAVTTIVDALTANGRIDNTVFIYASDNGYSLGAHRLEQKLCPYEECIKQPLIIRAPGLAPGTSDALVSNVDLAATVAEYAEVAIPPTNGRSLVPLLDGTAREWREEVLLEQLGDVPTNRKFYGLRTNQYLYVELFTGERELYDLYADPFQLTSIATENPDLVAALSARLAEMKGF